MRKFSQSENIAQLPADGLLPHGGNPAGSREHFFASKFDYEVAAANGLVVQSISFVEKHLVRPRRPIRWADGVADQAIERAEIRIARDPLGRDYHEIVRLLRVWIRDQDEVPLTKYSRHRSAATSRAAAFRMAFSSAISSGDSTIVSCRFGRRRIWARERLAGLRRASVGMKANVREEIPCARD
jgi:hypothetical protein